VKRFLARIVRKNAARNAGLARYQEATRDTQTAAFDDDRLLAGGACLRSGVID
jgi:hypothetical protein